MSNVIKLIGSDLEAHNTDPGVFNLMERGRKVGRLRRGAQGWVVFDCVDVNADAFPAFSTIPKALGHFSERHEMYPLALQARRPA